MYLHTSTTDIFRYYSKTIHFFRSFTDGHGDTIDIYTCCTVIQKAKLLGLIDFNDFLVEEYDRQNDRLNWIMPRLVAFKCPSTEEELESYIDYFLLNGVNTVIQLNVEAPSLNRQYFRRSGIHYFNLSFRDGLPPSEAIALAFLNTVERATGAVAVHCRAGLGRTGTLICRYLMKHLWFTAREAIAWVRICRPRSVNNAQQTWLEKGEPIWLRNPHQAKCYIHGIYSIRFRNYRRGVNRTN